MQARDSFGNFDALSSIENVRTGGGNDSVYGTAADELIETGAGNDFILSGGGSDTLVGGAGNDIYSYNNGAITGTIVELAGEGIDEIRGNAAVVSLAAIANVENIRSTSTAGATLTGNALNNRIQGFTGNDFINACAGGDDTLIGDAGDAGDAGDDGFFFGATRSADLQTS